MAVRRLVNEYHILKALKQLRLLGPKYEEDGICFNVLAYESGYSIPRNILAAWPGSMDTYGRYPVEGNPDIYRKGSKTKTLWQDPRRLELLDWLIAFYTRRVTLAALKHIRDCGPVLHSAGICYNVCTLSGDTVLIDTKLLQAWPDAQPGTSVFPVESVTEYITRRDNGTLWQNPRRLALLDWLIATLKEEEPQYV